MKAPAQPTSYYVIGESRTNADNAITRIYGSFYMAFEVDSTSEEILSFNCTHTLDLTQDYLGRIFLGQNFCQVDSWLEGVLKQYYGGSSRRAVIISYRDALKRYRAMRGGEHPCEHQLEL